MHMQAYSNTHRLNRWPEQRETGGVVKEGQAEERKNRLLVFLFLLIPLSLTLSPSLRSEGCRGR